MSRWMEFMQWEDKAAARGSGLTREQMIGARLYHDWLKTQDTPGRSLDRVTDLDGLGSEPMVIRPWSGPITTGSSTSAPWCGICAGWHIPGAGPCTATYSEART